MTRASAIAWVCLLASCGGTPAATTTVGRAKEPQPPVAERRPHDVVSPHETRNDPYYWMRDDTRSRRDVLDYLARENAYTEAMLGPAKPLEDKLFAEMRGRVKEDDSTVPYFDRGSWYYVRYETGKQYPIHARKPRTLEGTEEILLDGNALAKGHAFYAIGDYAVSPNGKLIAWTEDAVGRNQYVLRVKNLETGALLPDTATNISPSVEWANDDKTVFYVGKDPVSLREDRVFRHVLGASQELVHHETDASYYVDVSVSKSRRYVMIEMSSTTNAEVRLIDADKPAAAPRIFLARSPDHLYEVDHIGDRFVVLTNLDAKNFRVAEVAPGSESKPARWKELIPHRPGVLVESIALYDRFLAATIRAGGLSKVEVLPRGGAAFFVDAQDPAYEMSVLDTPDAASPRVRYSYASMTQPPSVFELDVAKRDRQLLKQQPVPTYDPTLYASEYVHAQATDGTRIPISIVYRKDTPRDGTAPLLVYGYGAYGSSSDPDFRASRVSLLDRGWVFAIAHVRGGQELGRAWYDDGKMMKKRNSFTDFIAATEYLVNNRYGARDRVFALGGSAGGLLVGAVANLRPDLYRGIVAFVPFVDVITTMLDESIPLTTNEFDEWGNPKADAATYAYMKSYSPYDNVTAQDYPSMYVRSGLWDSQVQYWEPTKWVAMLRATKRDTNPILLDTNMKAGHGGASGRFDALRETARAYAFMLDALSRPDRRRRTER